MSDLKKIPSIDKAIELLNQNPSLKDFDGEVKNSEIKKASSYLKVNFPDSYKKFLMIYGSGGIGGQEIYGITKNNFLNQEIPNVIGHNLKMRSQKVPSHILIISEVGNGESYALDLSQMNEENECPVVIWPLNGYEDTPDLEIVAPDFGTWFLNEVKLRIEWKEKSKS